MDFLYDYFESSAPIESIPVIADLFILLTHSYFDCSAWTKLKSIWLQYVVTMFFFRLIMVP